MSTTKKQKFFSVEKIAVTGILTAISWVLYMYVKFPLPFLFPSFLDIQFSDMPALLGGFAWGPWVGCAIVVLRGLLKMPFSGTACVGEIADIIIGIALVLPASLIYQKHKSKKGAIVSLLVGSACAVLASVIVNRFMLIPLYVKLLFNGSWAPLLGMVSGIYPDVTKETFYSYYILLATIPFNLLRCFICGIVTYFVYKPLSKALHWEFKPRNEGNATTNNTTTAVKKKAKSKPIVICNGNIKVKVTVKNAKRVEIDANSPKSFVLKITY